MCESVLVHSLQVFDPLLQATNRQEVATCRQVRPRAACHIGVITRKDAMAQLTQPGRNDNSDEGQPRIVARKGADPATGLLTVLLVDEDEDLRMYLRRCLEQIGPLLGQVFEASNGREALAVVQINDVDLLICGAHVSQMSDEALFSAIRADPGTASILIMQIADNEPANERLLRTRASLADAILDSPFNAAGFGACLARLIQSQ